MSETERADQIVAQRTRHRKVTAVIVVVLILSLGWNAWQQIAAQSYAQQAQTSAVSLAEQVQDRCDTEGSFLVGDRDLCDQADAVAEDPGGDLAPVNGRDGIDGTDGADGVDGTDGTDGKDGRPGKDGEPGTDGADGTDGEPGINGQPGLDGRGILSTECTTGGWIITYDDGLTDSDAGPCVGPQGVHGEQGPQGATGPQGTAKPGDYTCPDGEFMRGFSVADDGAVTLTCEATIPPVIENP